MTRLTRIVDVTAGLAVAGAIGGAVSGILILGLLNVIEVGIAKLFTIDALVVLGLAAGVGTVIGVFTAPLLAWGILRRVPLGKALLATVLGTVSGGVLGELLWQDRYVMPGLFLGGLAGFVLGGVVVWLISRQRVPSATERVEER